MEDHPVASIFPLLADSELRQLADDIRAHGLREPVHVYQGKILDGRNRARACVLAGIEPSFRAYEGDDPLGFVVSMNLHRRHLSESQRALVAARIADMKQGARRDLAQICARSQQEAADMLNVSRRSVQNAAAVLRNGDIEMAAAVERGDISVSHAVATLLPHVAHNSGEQEWYTPSEYIAAAVVVMGGIDLDPASSEIANDVVQARRYYTREDNGLDHKWRGGVWMNPPYASPLIGAFCAKFAQHVRAGDVPQGIVLVNNATETLWFRALIQVASAVVFPSGRVRFLNSQGDAVGAPLQGQAVIYAGPSPERFMQVFRAFGWGAML